MQIVSFIHQINNVEVIEDLIRNELKRLHPEITFTVYDTSDPKDTKKKRIIIKK